MRILAWAVAAALLAGPGLGLAIDQDAIRVATEEFRAARRVALEYLRTGNLDLASVELERLAARWQAARERLKGTGGEAELPPPQVDETLAESRAALETGNPTVAGLKLEAASAALDFWRTERGVRIYADCIRDIGAAFAAFDRARPDASQPIGEGSAATLVRTAEGARAALTRCDQEAPPDIRARPDFRRLMDGFLASLQLVPEAVARRDPEYLHRLIIEQRSFERLLAFRFG